MKHALVLCALMSFISCDWVVFQQGYVIDKETGEPISGARIDYMNEKDTTLSDTAGYFNVGVVGGGRSPRRVELVVTKDGYKPFYFGTERGFRKKEMRYVVKYECEDIPFNEPFYPDTTKRDTFLLSMSRHIYSNDFSVKKDILTIFMEKDDVATEVEAFKKSIIHP